MRAKAQSFLRGTGRLVRTRAPDIMTPKPKLLSLVRGRMRARHMSPRTGQAYVGWIIRYIRYHGTRHPATLGEEDIVACLTHLAAERGVARSTQMQAPVTRRLESCSLRASCRVTQDHASERRRVGERRARSNSRRQCPHAPQLGAGPPYTRRAGPALLRVTAHNPEASRRSTASELDPRGGMTCAAAAKELW